jgi:hypothetical protein
MEEYREMQHNWRPTLRKYIGERYIHNPLLSSYMNIANVVDEDTTAVSLEQILSDRDRRRKIIESLKFPAVNAADLGPDQNLRNLFQRTPDFDRFLDDTTSLIRGRKGTGKTALYELLLKHEDKDLVDRFAPVENIDLADEALVDRALQLLWGARREPNSKSKYVSRWVYDRLTDSSGTTFPRSLNILLKEAKNYELTSDQTTNRTDRLLLAKSLNEGLFEASNQRCQEVREEYPELSPFFNALAGLEVLASEQKLREVWQETAQGISPTFRDFIELLLSIGLIGPAELQRKEQGYRFAEIYTYGFNMYRGRRKY